MTYISSPIAYPPSSSPPEALESRKRAATSDLHAPSKKRLFSKDFIFPSVRDLGDLQKASIAAPSHDFRDSAEPKGSPFEDDELPGSVQHSLRASAPESSPMHDCSPASIQQENPTKRETWTCVSSTGRSHKIGRRSAATPISYEKLIAQRSTTAPGKAQTSFYGIEVHKILKEAQETKTRQAEKVQADAPIESVELPQGKKKHRHIMWTEKYRARKFTDLVGDERTHRSVLRWLKVWDPIVFPGATKPTPKFNIYEDQSEERAHRKVLLLTGPPGLGKTTLAHVCARQAGYEVVEINASDERSREVVKGRIRDCVGTENVRGVNSRVGDQTVRKAGRPVCVVVDEVDGVVSGSGGSGEGGFVKALIDLVLLDQKNCKTVPADSNNSKKRKKGDSFKLLRPMILICNDVYHPSLRPLRTSGLAEILHVRKPPLEKVIARMKHVFEKEGLAIENDGVRRLCEATWGISNRKEGRKNTNSGEGDIRGVLVTGEWAASKLRSSCRSSNQTPRLTRRWVEENLISDLMTGGSGARGMGRGGVKEALDRVFLDSAGFPKVVSSLSTDEDQAPVPHPSERLSAPSGVTAKSKTTSASLLRHLIDATGEHDRLTSDLFTTYPTRPFQDDTFLTKPNTAYDWLAFHDSISARVHHSQEWELAPYLPQTALAFHHLFASSSRSYAHSTNNNFAEDPQDSEEAHPFTGPRADHAFYESQRATFATLQSLHSNLSLPLHRAFRSAQELATDLIPALSCMLSPDVKPVVVGGSGENRGTASVRRESERGMVKRGAEAMLAVGVEFERVRVEDEEGRFGRAGGGHGWVWRMEPPIDDLATFTSASKTPGGGTSTASAPPPARYAVRQVLHQEATKLRALQAAASRSARTGVSSSGPLATFPLPPGPGSEDHDEKSPSDTKLLAPPQSTRHVKRDFFGRVIVNSERVVGSDEGGNGGGGQDRPGSGYSGKGKAGGGDKKRIWVSYHEGFSNAVRKPIGLRELMEGL